MSRRNTCALPIFAVLVTLEACGTSHEALEKARDARYRAPFVEIWNVVTQEVHKRYVGVHLEDPNHGVIETDYRAVEDINQDVASATTQQATGGATNLSAAQTQNRPLNRVRGDAIIFRMVVKVSGPEPWGVFVDGVAAHYDPQSPLPVPYHHGVIDEPAWVQARIDNLTVAIYDRLKDFAIVEKAKIAPKKVADPTTWANLPDPVVASVVGKVRRAAGDRDTASLRGLMVPDFRWADGADASADTAIAVWSADPSALRTLAKTLDAGCATDSASGEVVCPPEPKAEVGKARFRQVGATWKLVEFVR